MGGIAGSPGRAGQVAWTLLLVGLVVLGLVSAGHGRAATPEGTQAALLISIGGPSGTSPGRVTGGGFSCTLAATEAMFDDPDFPSAGGCLRFFTELGAQFTLTAQPAPGFSFGGWGRLCPGTDSTISITIDARFAFTGSGSVPNCIVSFNRIPVDDPCAESDRLLLGGDPQCEPEPCPAPEEGQTLIEGNDGPEVLNGTPGNDLICGEGGNDIIEGMGGDDEIYAGEGNDQVTGGDGRDFLFGGPGKDKLFGGPGFDRIDAGAGDDLLAGDFEPETIADFPRLTDTEGPIDTDVLLGGDGKDIVSYASRIASLTLAPNGRTESGQEGEGDAIGRDIETIIAGAGDDLMSAAPTGTTLAGGEGDDILTGGRGSDVLIGGFDDDTLFGKGAIDLLQGNQDDDILVPGPGKDRAEGGPGKDVFRAVDGKIDRLDGGADCDEARLDARDIRTSIERLGGSRCT